MKQQQSQDNPAYERELRSKLGQAKAKEDRAIHRLVKLLDGRLGRQSVTIANLRGELARTREEHSKIERGDLGRLERFQQHAIEQFNLDQERLDRAHDEIKRLREKLSDEPEDG